MGRRRGAGSAHCFPIGQDMQSNIADRHLTALGMPRRVEISIESFLRV